MINYDTKLNQINTAEDHIHDVMEVDQGHNVRGGISPWMDKCAYYM